MTLVLASALVVGAVTGWSHADVVNGGPGPAAPADPPIVVGADWFATMATPPAFFWSGSGPVWNTEGPYTFAAATNVQLFVTDDFMKGDRFEIFDFGASLGLTSNVPIVVGLEVGPAAAYLDPTYSSGVFNLGPGNHSITIQLVTNPYSTGRGYLKVIPGPATLSLLALGGLALMRRKRQ